MRLHGAFMLALLGAAPVAAQQVSAIRVVEYGIYSAQVDTPATGANEQMKSAKISKICHVQTTSVVPAVDDLHFGFRFGIGGPVRGETVDIKRVTRWPDHLQPPGAPYASKTETRKYRVGQTSYTGWVNWHTMPGTWTFQLFHEDRKFVEVAFTVVEQDKVKVVPDAHSTCFLMSSRERPSFIRVSER